jgi:hypothetical protein
VAAHGAYVDAINSNDTETLMADLTGDIVYQAPNEPEIREKTGAVTRDQGKGVKLFRRGSDDKWRVWVDGWSSDVQSRTRGGKER